MKLNLQATVYSIDKVYNFGLQNPLMFSDPVGTKFVSISFGILGSRYVGFIIFNGILTSEVLSKCISK